MTDKEKTALLRKLREIAARECRFDLVDAPDEVLLAAFEIVWKEKLN